MVLAHADVTRRMLMAIQLQLPGCEASVSIKPETVFRTGAVCYDIVEGKRQLLSGHVARERSHES